jgi:hypothetical protein
MSKYIEELKAGECFEVDRCFYLLTTDFKNNGQKMAIDLKTGFIRWFGASIIVEQSDIYVLQDNNFMPIKERPKDVLNQA